MNIRDTLKALVYFLREGRQSGNTTAALHGVAHVGPAPGKDWEHPRLVYLSEQDARRSMQAYKVPCMSLSDPHRLLTARPGPVVFDAWTVEQLAEKALQRIQVLELELEKERLKSVQGRVNTLRGREFTMQDFEKINDRVRDMVTVCPHMAGEARIQTWIDGVNEWLRGGA